MIHYVLLKFRPGALDHSMRQYIQDIYKRLADGLVSLHKAEVRFNCVEKDKNMDVMVRLELNGREALEEYLSHPLHEELAKRTKASVIHNVSFDYNISE